MMAMPDGRLHQEDLGKAETCAHHANPGQKRISNQHQFASHGNDAGLVQQVPCPCVPAELLRADTVEKVMEEDDGHAEECEPSQRQINQRGHGEHADAEDPENQKKNEKAKMKIEVVGKLHHREFKKDEPQAARQEKSGELAFAAVASPEKRSHTGGEHEDGQTEVGDPSGEEENRAWCG